jgi:hypothetical protein
VSLLQESVEYTVHRISTVRYAKFHIEERQVQSRPQ